MRMGREALPWRSSGSSEGDTKGRLGSIAISRLMEVGTGAL